MIQAGDKVYNTAVRVMGEVVYVDEATAAIQDAKGKVHEVVPHDCEYIDVYRQYAAELFNVKYHEVTVAQRQKAKRAMWHKIYGRDVLK